MRFTCEKSSLQPAIQTVKAAVSPRNPIPVLTGIKFEADGSGRVTLTGTDLEAEVRRSFPAEVAEGGAAVLPAAHADQLIRSLPDGLVIFEPLDGAGVCLRCGKVTAALRGFPPEEFPEFPIGPGEGPVRGIAIGGRGFKAAVKRVIFAVSDDETAPVYSSVLFEAGGGGINLVATDGYRLAWAKLPVPAGTAPEGEFLVPGRMLAEAAKAIGLNDEVTATLTGSFAVFSSGDTRFSVRLVDGAFPDYRSAIPKEFAAEAVVGGELAVAVERARLFSAKVRLAVDGGSLRVGAASEVGDFREELPARVEGRPLEAAFNAAYLLDAMRAVDGPALLRFGGPLSPLVVCPEAGPEEHFSIVLPMRQ